MQFRPMQGTLMRDVTRKLVTGLIGCAASLLVTHAALAATPTHKTARLIIHHPIYRHTPYRRPIVHHPIYHHPVYHRPTYHPVIYHHAVYHHVVYHHAIKHTVIEHRAVFHPPMIHYGVRKSYHRPLFHRTYHPLFRRADYLWCVPYARDISHIDLTGDAFLWWAEAAGRYARGQRPQDGAVLNFRSSARIRLGHVAVVARVINSREILVNQANWVPDQVSRDVPVIDVSPDNNWTMVRVSIGNGHFGAPYPTFGFIYDRPIGGGALYASRSSQTEVAAAPPIPHLRLTAPDRSVR